MKRIVVLTGSEMRHTFVRMFLGLSDEIEVARSFCEGTESSLATRVGSDDSDSYRKKHVIARQQAEEDFFSNFIESVSDRSNPRYICKGDINSPENAQRIVELAPDLLVAYGCSIIREPLLSAFAGRFLNVHLGLSPYYRGSGTNYWPLVNGQPEYLGATFMHIDAGVDTGDIIHQIRARVVWGDTPSSIGNRLISDMARAYQRIIVAFDALQPMQQLPVPDNARLYKRKDFTDDSVVKLYRHFAEGLVEGYLKREKQLCREVPIIENPVIGGSDH